MLNKSTISKYKKGLSAMFDGNETFLVEFDKLIEAYNINLKNSNPELAFRLWQSNARPALAGGYLCTLAFHFVTVIIVHLTPENSIDANMLSSANASAHIIGLPMGNIIKTINNVATALEKSRYVSDKPNISATSGCGGVSSSFRSGC